MRILFVLYTNSFWARRARQTFPLSSSSKARIGIVLCTDSAIGRQTLHNSLEPLPPCRSTKHQVFTITTLDGGGSGTAGPIQNRKNLTKWEADVLQLNYTMIPLSPNPIICIYLSSKSNTLKPIPIPTAT